MENFPQGGDGDLRHGSRGECPVEAHGVEPGLHIFKTLFADDDVAAYQKGNALQSCFVAFFSHAPAVQFSLPV